VSRPAGSSAGNRGTTETVAARRRAEEYFLQRRMFQRLSTAEIGNPTWLCFSFPTWPDLVALRRPGVGLDWT
jgi:hypothetical protein